VGTRIYVGNLPYSADNTQLSQLFTPFGDVVDARVVMDRTTGQSKGFGFVEMSTEEAARNAIASLNGTMMGNRTLRLDEAAERPSGARGGGYGGDRPRRDSGSYGRYGNDRPRRDDYGRW
jgi:cold-inducible RNA-binding protein